MRSIERLSESDVCVTKRTSHRAEGLRPRAREFLARTVRWSIQRHGPTRRGAVLVLALFFIVLAGSLSVLLSGSLARMVRWERAGHESIVLGQLLDSGRAWADAHREAPAGGDVVLSAEALIAEGKTGTVKVSIDPTSPGEIRVEARVTSREREVFQTAKYRFTL